MTDETRQENQHGSQNDDTYMTPFDASHLRRSLKTIMKPAIIMARETSVQDAVATMKSRRIGCVVITVERQLQGIFTERDVLKKIVGAELDLMATPLSAVMTPQPQSLGEFDTIAYALNFMDQGGYRHIPIVNAAFEPVGIVSIKDIVTYLVEHFADEILNLPAHPFTNPDAQPYRDFE